MIENLRDRQVKELPHGDDTLAGSADDFDGRRSAAHQQGNNNGTARTKDSWFDWTLVAKHAMCTGS